MASAITFKKCTGEKVVFILLNLIDMGLTVLAMSLGAEELNPFMREVIAAPYQLMMVKLVIPLFLAWLVPGKLLLPSIALLSLVIGWDMRELALSFF